MSYIKGDVPTITTNCIRGYKLTDANGKKEENQNSSDNCQLEYIEPARILAVFPTPCISHQIVFRPLVQELVRRGHEVTVITTDPAFPKDKAPSNLIEIDIHDISYSIWRQHYVDMNVKMDFVTQVEMAYKVVSSLFKAIITSNKVQDIIFKKHGNFDLLMLEACEPATLAFSHIFKVPVIQISSMGGLSINYNSVGASTYPLLYPSILSEKSHNLTKWEAIYHMYYDFMFEKYYYPTDELSKILPEVFGSDIPPINQLEKNIDMLFLNEYPFWKNQPVPPNVVHIGGLHKPPKNELIKDLQKILNSSKNGVIYFSFGTNVKPSLLPSNRIQMFIKAFSKLPYDVVWKWDSETLPEKSENIKIFKWLPQPELLSHPNVKLFITQGGLQSTDEAINAGVPLIGIPIHLDQWYNVDNYVLHKIGMKLDLVSLTEEQFSEAIKNVITDKSYRENVVKLRSLIEDQPQSPLERAVWGTEYVLQHGGAKHLRAASANVSKTQYLELDVLIILSFGVVFVIVLISFVFYYLFKSLQRRLTYKFKKI